MEIQIDTDRATRVGSVLLNAYKKTGIFGYKIENMPELSKPKGLKRASLQHIHYITLLVALDYMKDANQLWQAGVNTFNDKEVRWVFNINSEKLKNLNTLIKALQKHKVSKKPIKDAKIWQKIAFSIKRKFGGNIIRFIAGECKNNAEDIFSRMKTLYRKDFPNLTGNKILPLWIRMLKEVCRVKITNLNKIPFPVDVHTARATIFTGCLKGESIKTSIAEIAPKVDEVWTKAAEQSKKFGKFDLDEPLWTLSKYGCSKLKNKICPFFNNCPVKDFCEAVKKEIKVVQGNKGVIIE